MELVYRPDLGDPVVEVVQHRPSRQRQERLRDLVGERPEPGGVPGRKHQCLQLRPFR